jgi:TRAP-type C4-dicarboxylate transport system permease small subunit
MVPDSEKPPAGGLFARVEDLFATLSQWALAVLLALVVVQIVTRYVFNDPLGEVFFAIAALQRNDGHIRVDLLYVTLKGRIRQVIDLTIFVVSALFWAFVIYASSSETLFSLRMDYEISRTIPFPQWTALIVVPIGGMLILIRLLLQAVSTAVALNRPLPGERAR